MSFYYSNNPTATVNAIVAYFESEQGQREFAEWKSGQEVEKKEKSEVA